MLTIMPEALAIIEKRGQPIYLELPKVITNCCFEFQECPSVRFGEPYNKREYEKKIIQDITVFVPRRLPEIPLSLVVSSFLGIKRVVVDGWKLC